MENQTETSATPAPEAAPVEAQPAATPAESAPVTSAPEPAKVEPVEEAAITNRYEKSLEALMARARDNRRQQQEAEQQRQAAEFAQRVQTAAQYGPDAVMKALGMEQQKLDLQALLGGDEDDGEPKSVKELKKEIAELKAGLNKDRESAQQRAIEEQKQQYAAWEKSEMGKIEQFIDSSKEKYEYTAELKTIGSTKDIYGGIINMYQAGYTPSYEDMAGLVENRIEDILERLAPTKKFQAWAAKRLKPQSPATSQPSPTLTGALNSDSVAQAPIENETDEQNRRRAMQAALAKREALLRQMKGQ